MGIEIRDALRQSPTSATTSAPSSSPARAATSASGPTSRAAARCSTRRGCRAARAAERLSLKAWEVRKPVIAALNGAVAGVGATLPLQWDIRLAGESTRITFVFVKRGLVPEAASTWLLPRLVGMSRAADLLLTGRLVGAREALEMGLVSRVVPDAELLPTAQALAREIAEQTAPVAVALTKRLLWHMAGEPDPEAAERLDAQAFGWATQSPDAKEGIRAFLEKRPARWSMKPSTDLPDARRASGSDDGDARRLPRRRRGACARARGARLGGARHR